MKNAYFYILLIFLLPFAACKETAPQKEQAPIVTNEGTQLLNEMITTLGGLDKYRQLEDVTFTYIYRDTNRNAQDISIDKYMFDQERSWSKYSEHTKTVSKETPGIIIQGWNGEDAWMIEKGQFVTVPQALKMTKFARNTAYFWFNMMYKLVDPGAIHKRLPNRTYKGKEYQIVEVTYGANIGDAQDRMIIYMDPETKLVNNFLFVNSFMGETEPRMMEVSNYKDFNGLKFHTYMRYEPADWEGNILPGIQRAEKFFKDIRFNTGIDKSLFEKPDLADLDL